VVIPLSVCDNEINIYEHYNGSLLLLIQSISLYDQIIGVCSALGVPGGSTDEYGDWPMYACVTTEFFGSPWYSSVTLDFYYTAKTVLRSTEMDLLLRET
jgi:hypothetical protein